MQGRSFVERDVPRCQRITPIHLLPTRHAIVARVGLFPFERSDPTGLVLFQNWNKLA